MVNWWWNELVTIFFSIQNEQCDIKLTDQITLLAHKYY